MSDSSNRLYRSRADRRLAGVLGGIAERYGLDPSIVRIVYAIGTIVTGVVPGSVLYVMMALIIPTGSEAGEPG